MKLNEVVNKLGFVKAIPLAVNGERLNKSTAASVMLMRVGYDNAFADFQKDIQEIIKNAKPEGYDERAQKVERMKSIEKKAEDAKNWNGEGEEPKAPTKEELKEVEEIKAIVEQHEKETKELNEAVREAEQKALQEDVKVKHCNLTREEWSDIYEILGTEGDIKVTTVLGQELTMSKETYLNILAAEFVA